MFNEKKAYSVAARFLQVKELEDLAEVMEVKKTELLKLMLQLENQYREFMIPKRKGGGRVIDAPSDRLSGIQRRLNFLLQIMYYRIRPECVHGFIRTAKENTPSYSIASNAAVHVRAKYVLNMDLADFFHSISVHRIKKLFMSYPFYLPNRPAAFLALLSTYKERLPMGAPTSPVLSNFSCFLLDRRLMDYAAANGMKYTRYADDLSFSSEREITNQEVQAIAGIIRLYGFRVNEKKTRIQSYRGAQVVTGIKVNEKLNVNRSYVRSIRAMLHNWEKYGLAEASLDNKSPESFIRMIGGKLNFLRMVKGKEDPVYLKLKNKFRAMERTQVGQER